MHKKLTSQSPTYKAPHKSQAQGNNLFMSAETWRLLSTLKVLLFTS